MLRLAVFLFLIAIVAAFFGFSGVSILAVKGAELFFIVFAALAILGLAFGRRYIRY